MSQPNGRIGGIPDLAVIGTLEDVEENVWVSGFAPTLPPNKIRIIRKFYNSGWIEVESVLEGAVSGTRIPVIWPARTRCYPPVWGVPCISRGTSCHSVGEHRIWILWKPQRPDGPWNISFPEPYSSSMLFEALPVNELEQVVQELERLRLTRAGQRNRTTVALVLLGRNRFQRMW